MSIESALSLPIMLPVWFFSPVLVLSKGNVELFSAIPLLGIAALIIGVSIGVIKRQKRLLLFFYSVAFSEVFVAFSGLFRGQAHGLMVNVPIWLFMILQFMLIGFIVYRTRQIWPGAIPLTIFCIIYTLVASFVAAMSFSDTWI